MDGLMSQDILEISNFITEVENLLRLHNTPAAQTKLKELKHYIQIINGAVI